MNCQTCKELLVDYLYGELDAATSAKVDKALEQCADCRAELESLRKITQTLDTTPPLEVPAKLHADLLRIARVNAPVKRQSTWWAWAPIPAIALGALAVFAFPKFFNESDTSPAQEAVAARTAPHGDSVASAPPPAQADAPAAAARSANSAAPVGNTTTTSRATNDVTAALQQRAGLDSAGSVVAEAGPTDERARDIVARADLPSMVNETATNAVRGSAPALELERQAAARGGRAMGAARAADSDSPAEPSAQWVSQGQAPPQDLEFALEEQSDGYAPSRENTRGESLALGGAVSTGVSGDSAPGSAARGGASVTDSLTVSPARPVPPAPAASAWPAAPPLQAAAEAEGYPGEEAPMPYASAEAAEDRQSERLASSDSDQRNADEGALVSDFEAAMSAYERGEYRQAERAFANIVESRSGDADEVVSAQYYRAASLFQLGRMSSAEPLFADFIAAHPNHALADDAQVLLDAIVRDRETDAVRRSREPASSTTSEPR